MFQESEMPTIGILMHIPPSLRRVCGSAGALAAVLLALPPSAGGTSQVATLEKDFAVLDSALVRIPALPQVRMKEIDAVNGLFRNLIFSHPEISKIVRTNSRGVIVNETDRQGKA